MNSDLLTVSFLPSFYHHNHHPERHSSLRKHHWPKINQQVSTHFNLVFQILASHSNYYTLLVFVKPLAHIITILLNKKQVGTCNRQLGSSFLSQTDWRMNKGDSLITFFILKQKEKLKKRSRFQQRSVLPSEVDLLIFTFTLFCVFRFFAYESNKEAQTLGLHSLDLSCFLLSTQRRLSLQGETLTEQDNVQNIPVPSGADWKYTQELCQEHKNSHYIFQQGSWNLCTTSIPYKILG